MIYDNILTSSTAELLRLSTIGTKAAYVLWTSRSRNALDLEEPGGARLARWDTPHGCSAARLSFMFVFGHENASLRLRLTGVMPGPRSTHGLYGAATPDVSAAAVTFLARRLRPPLGSCREYCWATSCPSDTCTWCHDLHAVYIRAPLAVNFHSTDIQRCGPRATLQCPRWGMVEFMATFFHPPVHTLSSINGVCG